MNSQVTSDPNVMLGKPVIFGTRITVESILQRLAAGETVEEIVDSHPNLSAEAIQDGLAYAAEALGHEVVHGLPGEAA
jgi:uncharacterized protein (DUF433 family)